MNYNNWSMQNEIKKQVDRESLHDWAKNPAKIKIPKVTEPPKVKLSVGMWNLVRQLVP